jgi:hypothetical protein
VAGKKGKSGGKRPGAGRPRIKRTVSDLTIANWRSAALKFKREFGHTVEYHALKMLADASVQSTVKASILKTYNEALIVKKTETKSESHNFEHQGPAVGLPPMKEDPALKVVKGGSGE